MTEIYILNEVYTNGFHYNFLNIISIISIICGISVIVAKNPIVSVLFLIGLFFSIASYLMMLGMNFIGLSYLLVYVGAVSILFLFILMLINVRVSELITDNNNSFILAVIIGIFLFTPIHSKGNIFNNVVKETTTIYTEISNYGKHTDLIKDAMQSFNKIYSINEDNIYYVTSKIWDGALGELSHITNIGGIIYTNYPMWLILTSIILLLAMVGAIIITIKK